MKSIELGRFGTVASYLLLASPVVSASQEQTASLPPSRQIGEHESAIMHLAVSPDGKVLYLVGPAGAVYAWDLKKDELRWKTRPLGPMVGFGVGDDRLAYTVGSTAASFIDVETGEPQQGLGGPAVQRRSTSLVFDPKDRWVWLGTDTGSVTRLTPGDVNAWSNRAMDNHGVTSLSLDAKGKTLAVGGSDGTIRFVGAKSANRDDKKVIEAHAEPIAVVAFDTKGTLIVSGTGSGALAVWKYSNNRRTHELLGHTASIERIAVGPRGSRCASGDIDGVIKVWDLKKGEELLTLPAGGAVTGLVFLDKGKTLASTCGAEQVTLWDLSDL